MRGAPRSRHLWKRRGGATLAVHSTRPLLFYRAAHSLAPKWSLSRRSFVAAAVHDAARRNHPWVPTSRAAPMSAAPARVRGATPPWQQAASAHAVWAAGCLCSSCHWQQVPLAAGAFAGGLSARPSPRKSSGRAYTLHLHGIAGLQRYEELLVVDDTVGVTIEGGDERLRLLRREAERLEMHWILLTGSGGLGVVHGEGR